MAISSPNRRPSPPQWRRHKRACWESCKVWAAAIILRAESLPRGADLISIEDAMLLQALLYRSDADRHQLAASVLRYSGTARMELYEEEYKSEDQAKT